MALLLQGRCSAVFKELNSRLLKKNASFGVVHLGGGKIVSSVKEPALSQPMTSENTSVGAGKEQTTYTPRSLALLHFWPKIRA